MNTEEHVYDLLPAYALNSLDEEEKIIVAAHLVDCEKCQLELESYQQVVAELPLAMKTRQPPTHLKTAIFDQLAEYRQKADSRSQESWFDRLRSIFLSTAPVWGAASLVLVLVLLVSNLYLLNSLRTHQATQQKDLTTVALAATDYSPQAVGMLVISGDGEYGVLVVDHLPVLNETQQYQLWLIYNGQRTSGGVFSVNDEGYGSLLVTSEQPLSSYPAFGITIEPAGGSPGPTGEKVLGGEL
jgi:anti-sigma-K factor RskA